MADKSTRAEYNNRWLCHEAVLRREPALSLVGMSTFLASSEYDEPLLFLSLCYLELSLLFFLLFLAVFGGQVHYTNLGITPSREFFRPGPPECPGDGKRRLSNDYQLWDQISKASTQVTVVDFHQRLSNDYYQDLLMDNRAVATFDIDQVVPLGKHHQLCRVDRVPNS